MKALIRCTPPSQPAFWMATVIGLCKALLLADTSPSALDGHVKPKKKADPMYTKTMRQNTCLIAKGTATRGFLVSVAATATDSHPA